MSRQKVGSTSIQQDEIRNIICLLLKEVCSNVTTEPVLQPLQGEEFNYKTGNVEQYARVDLSARGFWNRGQQSLFDICIFNPLLPYYSRLSLEASHAINESDNIRKYCERIINVKQGTFTFLVFTRARGMAWQSQIFYKRMAEKSGGGKRILPYMAAM